MVDDNDKRGRLFVVADDLGYCGNRDEGIFECFKKQAIDSTSLLITGRCAESAVFLIKSLPSTQIGLHFNVTEGRPLSNPEAVKSLVSSSSNLTSDLLFHDKLTLRDLNRHGTINKDEIRTELSSQIKTFWDLVGDLPSRVDGHQHCHIISSAISLAFAETLQQFGITETRLPLDAVVNSSSYITKEDERSRFHLQVVEESLKAREIFDTVKIRYPKAFIGLTLMGSNLDIASLSEAAELVKKASACELMVHPGYPSNETCNATNCGCLGTDGPDLFSSSIDRKHELEVLTSDDFIKNFRL